MQLFGYALPFIGFKTFPIDWDGDVFFITEDTVYTGFVSDCLTLMWFGYGLVLFIGKIRRAE